ncbi:2Fe-2S iron-sulfur cluster-binding protein [Citricoccus sp. NR2]|uniref:2Fe-2S iron-sulfur cluster-binding protein n=1 Tax=Citricoccus sp. NR2 TaxID=3004095 RepID=UPI0022DD7FB3|nr:2Fe-2S iron-sulfur cluster-binding protein [Citricoccus sp. NR2]WBL19213.1 2Fe-2S iron-sulfur cluster-binding protein [Citricoccus sp. NR2]
MSTITYHQPDGQTQVLELDQPERIMQAALKNSVPGIVGECGGQAMCATCHVYVREEYLDALPEISEDEEEMLEVTASERDERRSRLGCQIEVGGPGLESIEVDVPEEQI